jgi:cytochrome d ubiquinol oxidase subunit II
MADLWYALVATLLTAYVVLDGFDLGAGALHRVVARTDDERRAVLGAIGPYWDGNEVFLLAAGGTLFAAFSRALAVGLSGLYLAVFLLLWALVLRGISIEFRSHLRDGMWRAVWDAVFQGSSAALALLLGVALGTVVRGYPFGADGWFTLELFSLASPREARGIIDGYTLAVGLFAEAALVAHGGRFLAWKTEGALAERSLRAAEIAQGVTVGLWVAVTALSWAYAPAVTAGFVARPLAWAALAVAVGAMAAARVLGRRGRHRDAFVASAGFLGALLAMVAVAAWPVLVRDVGGARSLTVATARNAEASLAAGLRWWFFAAALVAGYFVNLFRLHARPQR